MLARLLGKHETSCPATPAVAAPMFRRGFKKRELSTILGCSVRAVDRLIAAGELKAHKLNARHIIILGDDFEAFLAKTQMKAAV